MKFKTLFLSLILVASFLLSFNSYANCDPDFDVFCEPNNQGYGTNSNQNNASISTAQATLSKAFDAYSKGGYETAFQIIKPLAEQGSAQAQYRLGVLYSQGKGVEQDDTQAVYWYRKAVNQGYANAQYNLAFAYAKGEGVEQDNTQAVYWYRKAANQGGAKAQNNLGLMYSEGVGVEQDDTQAVYWYRKAANQGFATGQYNLAQMYRRGRGVEQDDTQAVYWYRKAANQGDASAQSNLGMLYYEGRGVAKNMNKAAYWTKKAKDKGNKKAIENWAKYNLGQYTAEKQTTTKLPTLEEAIKDYEAKDYKSAFSKFLKLAKAGDKSSQGWLGWMYREGEGVEQDDTQAIYWYRKAANQGYDYAQYNLGLMYDEGRVVERDYRQAFKWYKKAAYQENASAQNNLGLMYENGTGVEQDYTQAVYWYKKAANQGNASAQNNLGLMYVIGKGVAKNMNTAAYWIKKAKDKGSKKSIENWVEYNLGQYTVENQTNKKLPALEEAFKSHKAKDYVGGLQGLFGIKLNKDVNNYVSETYLYKNKSKYKESKNGFFDVNMTDEIPNKSPYFDKYFIAIDNNNRVHEIFASKSIASLDACLSQMETLKDSFRSQYQLSFGYDEKGFSTETSDHKTYINSVYTDNDDYLSLQCNLRHNDNSVFSQAILRTKKLSEAVDNFYFSALKPFSNKDNTATSQGSDITTKLPTLKDAIKNHKAKDYKSAFSKFLKLAKAGDAVAQSWLGSMYAQGTGIEKDAEQAFKWWTKAAKQGDAYAQHNLGGLYLTGDGVKKDPKKGLDLITKAAEQGYKKAKEFLDELKKNPLGSTGTGFVVTKDGVIATAEHVVNDCKRIKVDNLEASIVVSDKQNDIALIKVDKAYQDIANIKVRSPKLGMDVMAFGFPLSDTLSSTHISVTKGSVSSLSGFKDDTSRFRYTAASQPGNSGGPIVNDKGRVVGVVSAVMKNDKDSDINRQNVNFGVRSSLLVSLMDSKNIDVATQGIPKDKIIRHYEKVTKYIKCFQ